VASPLALEDSADSVIVMEDLGGLSLAEHGKAGAWPLAEFLRLALELAQAVGEIHQRGVIHKDLNASNVQFEPATGAIQIIDFGIATQLAKEVLEFRPATVLEGTLPYISPEQTGRMNRGLDYRSDFYSLGVTLYELLTGRLPFASDDPLAVVHAHVASAPAPSHGIDPETPKALSDLVLKLMVKDADDRYGSSFGLCADLERVAQDLETGRAPPRGRPSSSPDPHSGRVDAWQGVFRSSGRTGHG